MKIDGTAGSVAALAARLTDGVAFGEPLGLDVGGCRVDVLTDEPELHARLARYFRDHVSSRASEPDFRILAVEAPTPEIGLPLTVKSPDPGKRRVKEEYHDFPDGRLVRKVLTGMVFVFGGDRHVAIGPCLANDNQIVNFVNNRYMQWRLQQGYLLCHAGAVARDGRGLALCGTSGAGKSTTSLALVSEGLDFVSNDRVLLRAAEDGEVELHGIPKHPRVNPGTLLNHPLLREGVSPEDRARWGALGPDALRGLEEKHDVIIDEVWGPGRFRMSATLEALVVIAWNGEGPARMRRVGLSERRDLLEHVVKSPGLFYEPDVDEPVVDLSPEAYVEVLGRRPTFEITGTRDFAAARVLCLSALDGAAVP